MTKRATLCVLLGSILVAACGDPGARPSSDGGATPAVLDPQPGIIAGTVSDAGIPPSATCDTPRLVADPWLASVHARDAESGAPVGGATLTVHDAGGALLASATTDDGGTAKLSLATGSAPIDGSVSLSKDGYLTTRIHVQGGLGWLADLDAPMSRTADANAQVLAATGEPRTPGTALLVVQVSECNAPPGASGVRNATVRLAHADTQVVYANAYGSWDPWLDRTTTSGSALIANQPPGDALLGIAIGDNTLEQRITLAPDTRDVIVAYPRGPVKAPLCEPGDVTAFEPDHRPPLGLAQGACTSKQIDELVTACFAGQGGCTSFRTNPANADCYSCAIAHPDSPHWNGIVDFDNLGFVQGLPSQCIAAFEGPRAQPSCGAKLTALFQCELAACADNCPIRADTGADDMVAFDTCLAGARAGGCLTLAIDAEMCASSLLGRGNPVDQCLVAYGESFSSWAQRELGLVCGDGSG